MAKVISDLILDAQVLFELVVVLDDFVSASLEIVDEGTAALGHQ